MNHPTPANPATITFQKRSLWLTGGGVALALAGVATALALQRGPQAAPLTQPALLIDGPATDEGAPPAPPAAPEARLMTKAACATCGTVESVQVVKTEGPATGAGAVAGGVLGGVLGHQIGGGNGRKAMAVVGAVGGGLAGHEIEKRRNATTAWRVTVRKDDGTRATFTRSEPWAAGTRVSVAGGALRTL